MQTASRGGHSTERGSGGRPFKLANLAPNAKLFAQLPKGSHRVLRCRSELCGRSMCRQDRGLLTGRSVR